MSAAPTLTARSGRQTSDEDLLTASDADAFGVFYTRHVAGVEKYFARRVRREAAADLAAETFAAAFRSRRRFVRGATPAAGWLYTIAARRLIDYQRRGLTEQRTLEALTGEAECARASTPEPPLELVSDLSAGLLRHLPHEQRQAVEDHLVDGLDYRQIAARSNTSEASVRQRVSRGLGALREPLRLYREAQALAAQDRVYDWGGGHGQDLRTILPSDPLDCSASASLIFQRAGLFDSHEAWTSDRFAAGWGRSGEGRYVTVWAHEEHVWIEFKLDSECGEHFDPTPARIAPECERPPLAPDPTLDYVPRHWRGL